MTNKMTKDDIINAVAEMSVMEVVELVTAMEEKFGVSAAVAGPGPAPTKAEQTEFDLVIKEAGSKKINVIKVVRELTGLGIKEAKAVVDGVPTTLKSAMQKEEAEAAKQKLEEAGATAEIK